jgi:DHA1 family multidrug resistance protein-like MFS transporter
MGALDDKTWKRTLYASAVAQFIGMFAGSLAFPFLPFYIEELGVKDPDQLKIWSGLVVSASSLMMALSAPIWGHLSDVFSRKLMMLRSMLGMMVLMALMGFARTPTELLVLRLLQGILAGTAAANTALLASIVPVEKTASALGLLQATALSGSILGPAIGGIMAEHVGYRPAFWVGAACVAVSFFLVLFYVEEPAREPDPPGRKNTGMSYGAMFAVTAFIIVLIARFHINFSGAIGLPLFPLYVKGFLGRDQGAAAITGYILASSTIAMVIATPLIGRLSDRWGHKRTLVVSTLTSSIAMLLFAGAHGIADLWVLRCLLAVFLAGINPSANAILRRIISHRSLGKAYGLSQSMQSFGGAVGPAAGGFIAALIPGQNGIRVAFLATGALMLLVPLLIARYLRSADDKAVPQAS